MNDKRTIIALVIIGLILLLMPTYMRWFYGPTETPPPPPQTDLPDSLMTQAVTADTIGAWSRDDVTETEPIQPTTSEPEQAGVDQIPGSGRALTVVTPLYTATMNTRGAVIEKWRLRNYQREDEPPIQMLPPGTWGPVFEIPLGEERLNALNLVFSCDAPDTIRIGPGEETTLVMSAEVADERQAVRRLTFNGDGYAVGINDAFTGFTTTPMNDAYRLLWVGGLNFTETSTDKTRREDVQYSGFYGSQGGDVQKTRLKQDHVEEQLFGSVEWVALRTKYFTAALVPQGELFRTVRMSGQAGENGPPRMQLAAEREIETTAGSEIGTLLYLGPIDYSILREYEVGLEGMMDFGFSIIKPISKFVLILFTFLHGYIPNYGLVLIVFSILVKVVVFPLTRKSYESMHAMQELTPRMQEIREKYKDDPEKMNKKIMNLYKENKVNPLGGCFPLLLQMPVFWALFIVFRTTIELRGAPFVLWINDLSMADPYMVLPGLMSLTMLLQQRAQLKNPQQRTMALLMPIMFFFLFKSFPAGLVLYWTLFNILSIVQTELVHKRPAAAETAGTGTGRSGKGSANGRTPVQSGRGQKAGKGGPVQKPGGRKKR